MFPINSSKFLQISIINYKLFEISFKIIIEKISYHEWTNFRPKKSSNTFVISN